MPVGRALHISFNCGILCEPLTHLNMEVRRSRGISRSICSTFHIRVRVLLCGGDGRRRDCDTLVAVTGALPFIEAGTLRALIVGARTRLLLLPEVPTVEEATGDPHIMVSTFYGMAAPASTSREIVDALTSCLMRAIERPDVADKLIANGLVPAFASPAELAQIIEIDLSKFATRVKKIGITPQ